MSTIAELVVKVTANADELESNARRAADRVEGSFDRLGGRAQQLGDRMSNVGRRTADMGMRATVGFTAPLLLGFQQAEAAATNLAEAQNATNQIFGEGASEIDRFAENSAEAVGLSERAFREAVTPLGALLGNFGLSQREAAEEAINLTERASDMASVFNTDVDQALGAITAGLRGEADPLEQFGVRLNSAAIEAEAMSMGLADSKDELDDNAKAQAALSLIMSQTEDVAGDFRDTVDGNANAQRVLAARTEDAAAEFGENLQPAKAEVLKVATKLLEVFNNLSPRQQKLAVTAGLVAAAMGPVMTIVGNVVRVTGFLVKGSGKAIQAFGKMGSAAIRGGGKVASGASKAAKAMARLAAQAVKTAARVVASFVRMAVQAAAATARVVAQIAIQIGKWILLGIQSLLAAAKVALAWLISLGPIALIVAAVIAAVALIIANWDKISEFAGKAFEKVKEFAQTAIDWLREHWPIILAILTGPVGIAVLMIVKHWDTIKEKAAQALAWVKDRATDAKDWVVARFNDVLTFFRALPGRIRSAASGMWDGLEDSFRSALNNIIRWWNGISFRLPTIRIPGFDPPGPGPSFSGFDIGGQTFSTPNIPALAKGGIVPATPGGRLVKAGEGGQDEAVVPLPNGIRDLMRDRDQPQEFRLVVDATGIDDDMAQVVEKLLRTGRLEAV